MLPQGQRYFCHFQPHLCSLQSWSRCTKHGFWKNVKPSTPAWHPRSFAFQSIGSLTSRPTLTSIALHLASYINRYSSMQLQGLETVQLGIHFPTSRKSCLSEKEGCCKARQYAKYELFKFTVLISFKEKAAWDLYCAMMYQHAPKNECKRYAKLKIY